MEHPLHIYNTLTRRKEQFVPLHEPFVGMYVCGPTVYGDAHLGHARPAITFDVLFRYLKHLGYKVRYVRNITDVGHLEHDADSGEDKIAKKARLEQLEPMEVVQYYLNRYHQAMDALNVLPPSIEPHASGHIIEQIDLVKKILDNDMLMKARVRYTSMLRSIIKIIGTESCRDGILRICSIQHVLLTDRKRNIIQLTLLFGSVHSRNISCVGLLRGVMVSPDGIANVRPWERNIWVKTSIFTVAVWT